MNSYPPLQPVDDNLVGFVGDVERHHTQVGEIPKELWKKIFKSIRNLFFTVKCL